MIERTFEAVLFDALHAAVERDHAITSMREVAARPTNFPNAFVGLLPDRFQ